MDLAGGTGFEGRSGGFSNLDVVEFGKNIGDFTIDFGWIFLSIFDSTRGNFHLAEANERQIVMFVPTRLGFSEHGTNKQTGKSQAIKHKPWTWRHGGSGSLKSGSPDFSTIMCVKVKDQQMAQQMAIPIREKP